jgi:hypothetical protein
MKKSFTELELSEIETKWTMLTEEQQNFVKNVFSKLHGKDLINEETYWYNTLLDVVGFLDPTGIADLTNSLLYFKQKEYFFCFLSLIAVVPYFGDFVAKPIMGLGKGSRLVKGMDEALRLAKSGNVSSASRILQNSTKASPLMNKMVQSSAKWGSKLKDLIMNLPGGKFTIGLKKTLNDWIDLFINASRIGTKSSIRVASAGRRIKSMTPQQATQFLQTLEKSIHSNAKLFRNFKPKDPSFMAKYFWPGATVGILWRNRSLAGLVNRTKFYAGFLSTLSLPFMSTDELSEKMSEEELNKKFQEYAKSPEGQQNWQDDFGETSPQESQPQVNQSTTSQSEIKTSGDPLIDTFDEMFGLI